MSVAAHRAQAPVSVPCLIVTISDTRTPESDTSGRAIAEMIVAAGHTVAAHELVPDDPARVVEVVRRHVGGGGVRAVITTGGTGFTSRDTTVEALSKMFERTMDGFGELFRRLSYDEVGPAAMLSRACAGVVGGCIVFALPGSEAAVRLGLRHLILPELPHIVRELSR